MDGCQCILKLSVLISSAATLPGIFIWLILYNSNFNHSCSRILIFCIVLISKENYCRYTLKITKILFPISFIDNKLAYICCSYLALLKYLIHTTYKSGWMVFLLIQTYLFIIRCKQTIPTTTWHSRLLKT